MLPYFIMVGVPALLALLFQNIKIDKQKATRIVIDTFFIIWIVLLFFRSEEVGTDLLTYKYHFFQWSGRSFLDLFQAFILGEIEVGYYFVAKIVSLFSSQFQWVVIACACISAIPIWRLYRKEGKFGFLLILLFTVCRWRFWH